MKGRQLKKEVLSILQGSDLDVIYQELSRFCGQRLLGPLFGALCHRLENVRWHAVCSFGRIVPAIEEKNMESARVVMRRFLWALNDESGGIGWGGPEAMAEIMCQSSPLRREYLHMFISYMRPDGTEQFQDGNYLELPMLQRGLLWGVARLCQSHRKEMLGRQIVADVAGYLDSSDHYVSGLALYCLGLLGGDIPLEKVRYFCNSYIELDLFLDYKMQLVSVAELARKVYNSLEMDF